MTERSVIEAYYYTDPACPWSWAAEPALRRLRAEFGEGLRMRYVMAGMAREFGDVEPLARSCVEAGLASGMPVDPRIWWEGAPASSYPACVAVKAAEEQGLADAYLRRLREGLLCRRRKLDNAEALVAEAHGLLDVERFRIAIGSHALLEAFGADLELGRAVPAEHHGEGAGRVKLPSVEFRGSDGAVHGVYGPSSYEAYHAAALAAGAVRGSSVVVPSVLDALGAWGSMATVEVAAVCQLPGPRAPAALWQAALEWQVKAERAGTGELWSLA